MWSWKFKNALAWEKVTFHLHVQKISASKHVVAPSRCFAWDHAQNVRHSGSSGWSYQAEACRNAFWLCRRHVTLFVLFRYLLDHFTQTERIITTIQHCVRHHLGVTVLIKKCTAYIDVHQNIEMLCKSKKSTNVFSHIFVKKYAHIMYQMHNGDQLFCSEDIHSTCYGNRKHYE